MFVRLPSLTYMPLSLAFSAGVGFVFGKLAGGSPKLFAVIFTIRNIVQDIFFILASRVCKNDSQKLSLYGFTYLVFGAVEIIALRHFQLIASKGTMALTGLSLWAFMFYEKYAINSENVKIYYF